MPEGLNLAPGKSARASNGLPVVLVGPPNVGKSTLFQALTGVRARIVNYPGATVDLQEGRWVGTGTGEGWRVLDTPGIVGLEPRGADEAVTRQILFPAGVARNPRVVLVLDQTQLARHLYLAFQLREAGLPVVVALTMGDLLAEQGHEVRVADLEASLRMPVVRVDTGDPKSLEVLAEAVAALPVVTTAPEPPVPWDRARVEDARQDADALALRVLVPVPRPDPRVRLPLHERLDPWLLHPFWGFLVFFVAMAAVFSAVFWVAQPAMEVVDALVGSAGGWLHDRLPPGALADFVRDGLVAGLGSVLMFVPQIALLFLAMILLEDSGYLARAATMADRPLSVLGLEGRSFVPLLSGFACAIPAMLATRTIPDARIRRLTILVVPLASCSARLPVYALILGFLVPADKPWLGGVALATLYLGGLALAALLAWCVSRALPADVRASVPFVLELPVYRRPVAKRVIQGVLLKVRSYLERATLPITIVATLLWAATYFPVAGDDPVLRMQGSYAAHWGKAIDFAFAPLGLDWRAGVALIAAFAAREVFVASLALALGVTAVRDGLQAGLLASMAKATLQDGAPMFTLASGVALLVYFVVAMQCASTFVVAWRESGSARVAWGQLLGFNALAYGLAALVYRALA
ncbi:MAG: ferrous iron transporter B [Candidatus Sericytochromatia bacterium]|nr:ferrous iron transporter B [Candidatus Tanganyikabacteria bacterium]